MKHWIFIVIFASTTAVQAEDVIFADSFEFIPVPRITVVLDDAAVPPEMAGGYDKAFNCTFNEGGGSGSGVDSRICFRKIDGSSWRIWNTGCGWEIGRQEEDDGDLEWQRYARSYTGQCSEMPPVQIDTRALSTNQYVNGFGDPLAGVESRRFESDVCESP